MSLATRLSAFFLAALALVLLGFSGALYLLARTYLHHQAEERLESTLDTLAAVAEHEEGGLEWDAHERELGLGQGFGGEQVRWQVSGDGGRSIGRSANLAGRDLWPEGSPPGANWKFASRRLRAKSPPVPEAGATASPRRHTELLLTAGVSREPLDATLRTLAFTLTGLSLLLWGSAALGGRWLCRRALTPMTRMAVAARQMRAGDLAERLPVPRTADELADLGNAFNDLLGRLQEAFERQRRFTGDASHQLRTPLTALLGQVEVALRRDRTVGEYRELLGLVHGQADHLRRVVEAMLFLARADVEAGLGELEALNLTAWVSGHLARWAGPARKTEIGLQAEPEVALWVRAQAPLLGQLLDNLLENACKYSPPGSPIVVRLTREGGCVVLAVEDHGGGIAAGDLPHVFEPFYRSAEARRLGRPGVGLGLAVARRIAGALGGTLDAESEVGCGSRFTLRLPALR